ncbi:hypothetical protein STRAU_5318 [Streptomyces aurantiacus JA 4570]|uniref:Uncharacterized protein n=1 Tax=Streptomyces aurantiacus JA 4570 TaxID=1286094 RepID=S3ZT88_9ACTN|nr:hypothetical protein STRAU_5318 [Streptomyces aurantiacus JA 4570]
MCPSPLVGRGAGATGPTSPDVIPTRKRRSPSVCRASPPARPCTEGPRAPDIQLAPSCRGANAGDECHGRRSCLRPVGQKSVCWAQVSDPEGGRPLGGPEALPPWTRHRVRVACRRHGVKGAVRRVPGSCRGGYVVGRSAPRRAVLHPAPVACFRPRSLTFLDRRPPCPSRHLPRRIRPR